MSWVTTVVATYEEESVERIHELLAAIAEKENLVVTWDESTVTIVDDYGTGSKYGPARPAISALRTIFDPIADDEYYRPWPLSLTLSTEWREDSG